MDSHVCDILMRGLKKVEEKKKEWSNRRRTGRNQARGQVEARPQSLPDPAASWGTIHPQSLSRQVTGLLLSCSSELLARVRGV